jgi:hypothetical protein
MDSVIDLIINEIANVLGIPPSEVKSKFTEQQLKELYDLSLCDPTDEVGAPFGQITELPCEEPAPQLLPELSTADIEKLIQDLENTPTANPVKKCIDSVETISASLEKERELYVKYSALHDKLIEYQDNFEPVASYFEERANELARILKEFSSVLEKEKALKIKLDQANTERSTLLNKITKGANIANLSVSLEMINLNIANLESQVLVQQNLLKGKEASIPVFNNKYYNALVGGLNSGAANSDISTALSNLYSNYIDRSQLTQIQSQISAYSQCIQVFEVGSAPTSVNQAANQSFFKFKINFPQLFSFKLETQVQDQQTKTYVNQKVDFPVKGNSLLEKQSFFSSSSIFSVDELSQATDVPVLGKIYTNYYNLLADPINNLFTLDDRGLTTEAAAIDPKVKGTESEKKRENGSEYFVKDLDKLQQFYQNFEVTFDNKKREKRMQVIDPAKDGIRAVFRNIARREVQLLLAIGRVNKFTTDSSSTLRNIVNGIKNQNLAVVTALSDLSSEIARIKGVMDDLKPSPEKVKARLKKQSPECFDKMDQETQPANCVSVMGKLGKDPLYLKSITEGTDATLPCSNQLCYWVQFSLVANIMGLIPMPNLPNFNQLRYWPVGFVIPTPGGLIKIPLPVIWLPLVSIATPMGTIVIFLTINGIFISPIIFFVSSTGFKQHIFTVRGPSPKFGFSGDEESIKPGVQKSVAFLANREKIQRLAKEAIGGKEFNLSSAQKAQVAKQRNILNVVESTAKSSGNKNRLLKVAREKRNLELSISNLGPHERLQNILDKTESAKDAIEDAKRAIHQRINDLGKPNLTKANELKTKITKRQDQLLLNLQQALANGDDAAAKTIREQVKIDGSDMDEKISAIKADMKTYYDRLKFPTISIPKDSSKLEPQPNAILDFLNEVLEFSSMYKSNFISQDSLKLRNMLLVQLAKNKTKIKTKIDGDLASGQSLDVEKDFDKIQKYLLDVNSTLVDSLKGSGGEAAVKAQAAKVNSQKDKVNAEKDPKKKRDLEKELQTLQVQFSDIFDNARVKEALALTPAALAALGQLKVDFNPFSPCCAKSGFQLDLSGLSPAIPIIESVRLVLDGYVKSLTPKQFKSLVGDKKTISPRELTSSYIGIIKNTVPANLAIPVPAFNLLTFAASFSGILASLFELRIPNPARTPFPARIKIDLNLLKPVLLNALMDFLDNSLPDPKKYTAPSPKQITPAGSTLTAGEAAALSSKPAQPTKLDSDIKIVTCEPDDSQKSAISDGGYKPNVNYDSPDDVNTNLSTRSIIKAPTSSPFSSGNVVAQSDRDVLPSFSTLDFDFLSINPSDLLAVLKNFIDLGFDIAEKILDQFYKIISLLKSAKGTKINLLESIQYSLPSFFPPIAPPYLPTFIGITKIRENTGKSNTMQIMDTDVIQEKLKIVETVLGPIANSPLPMLVALIAGIADHVTATVPLPPTPKLDTTNFSFSMVDSTKPSYLTVRNLHPVVSQDDIPSWERLSPANPLFLLFVDQFLAAGADKVGLFREYL